MVAAKLAEKKAAENAANAAKIAAKAAEEVATWPYIFGRIWHSKTKYKIVINNCKRIQTDFNIIQNN